MQEKKNVKEDVQRKKAKAGPRQHRGIREGVRVRQEERQI